MVGGDRTDDFHVPAGEANAGLFAVGDGDRGTLGQVQRGRDLGVGEEQLDGGQLFGGEADGALGEGDAGGAAALDQVIEQFGRRGQAVDAERGEAEQEVV